MTNVNRNFTISQPKSERTQLQLSDISLKFKKGGTVDNKLRFGLKGILGNN